MLNVATKTDGVSTLSAAEFNSYMVELENMVTLSGQTLNGAINQQLMNAVAIYAAGGASYVDSGAANAYVLSPIGVKVAPISYFNGMEVTFKIGNTNTGASTVNVAGLGAVNIKQLGGADPVSSQLPVGAVCTLWYNSGASYFEIKSVSQAASTNSSIAIQGARKKLIGFWASNTTATWQAQQLVLQTSGGISYLVSAFNKTLNIASSGAGGLDTGSIANNTFYHVFAIYNGTVLNILCSLSETSPTLPSGYTFFAKIGTILTDGSAHIIGFYQRDNESDWSVGNNLANLPVQATGVQGDPVTPTYIQTTAVAPASASKIILSQYSSGTANTIAAVAGNANYGGISSSNPPPNILYGSNVSETLARPCSILLEGPYIYVAQQANNILYAVGYIDNF